MEITSQNRDVGHTASYNAANQVVSVSQSTPISYSGTFVYDAAGNVYQDVVNTYAYDAEGRLCAVKQPAINGGAQYQYLYNAAGLRVGKATFTGTFPAKNATCAAPGIAAGFTLASQYLLDLSGDQVTELTGTGAWKHSNVWAGSHLDATYDAVGLHFHLADPLGTRRVQTNVLGQVEANFQSLPFGDNLLLAITTLGTADDSTEHHFTGKERDTESGNDYFDARYYGSSMGRFLSPDPISGTLSNPQSLNRYLYVLNNPLIFTDPTGMIVDWEDSKKGKDGKTNAQRAFEKRLDQLKNSKSKSDQAKGASLGTTYDRLQASKATFEVVKPDSTGSSRGDLEYDGNNHFTVNLKGDMTNAAGFTDNQKIAHEFEHGRQVLDGELSYQDYTGTWQPWAHDRTDESKGFAAGFDIESASPGQGAFIQGMQQAIRFGGVAGGAIRLGMPDSPYKNLDQGPNNVDFKSPAIYSVPQ